MPIIPTRPITRAMPPDVRLVNAGGRLGPRGLAARSADAARHDAVHRDPATGELGGESPREAAESGLGGYHMGAFHRAGICRRATDVDDPTAFAALQPPGETRL